MLFLPTILDDLLKQAMVIAYSIPASRDAEARHAFHKASCEAPEPAIAEGGVRLGAAHPLGIDAEVTERKTDHLTVPKISDDVVEQSPDQELQRQVINALAALGAVEAIDRKPTMNDAVAQRQRCCDKPVPIGCRDRVFAHRQGQFGEQCGFEIFDVLVPYRWFVQRSLSVAFGEIAPRNVRWHSVETL